MAHRLRFEYPLSSQRVDASIGQRRRDIAQFSCSDLLGTALEIELDHSLEVAVGRKALFPTVASNQFIWYRAFGANVFFDLETAKCFTLIIDIPVSAQT